MGRFLDLLKSLIPAATYSYSAESPLPTITPTNSPTPSPTLPPIATPTPGSIEGYSNGKIPGQYIEMIQKASKENNFDPAFLSALIFNESGFKPDAVNKGVTQDGREYIDRGIAQINSTANPDIPDEKAFDPNFAIDWAAKKLRSNIDAFGGDVSRGLAAYNVGRGGASVQGENPYGGGPRGQQYINRVAKNMTPETVKKIGLKTGPIVPAP